MASPAADRQKQLKEFIERRHPEYSGMAPHWEFLEETYEGGRCWFPGNIFKYIKEGKKEYFDRVKRAYRFNHTREVVDLVVKYLFKMEITRNLVDAPASVKKFWQAATMNKASIADFAKRIANRASVFGRSWIVIDRTANTALTATESGVVSVADEKKSNARTYAYIVEPYNVCDMGYDELGELNWILIHEVVRDDEDPILASGKLKDRYRLWSRTDSRVFEVDVNERGKMTIIEHDAVTHNLGEVPVFAADDVISDRLYSSPALIADVAYLDRAIANYLSNLDAIIQDQTFSQMVMPAQGLLPGEAGYDKLVEMGTKRVFTYDAEHGGKPEFISPDVKQAEIILKVINKIINEIYHSVGLAGERTKEDNALGIDNSSGVAKAYDFERVNSLLAAKADALQMIENKLCYFVALWNGEESQLTDERLVLYPDNFDVRGLQDEFQIAARLDLIEAPDSVRREQMGRMIDKLFPQLTADIKAKIADELKTWPPKMTVGADGQMTGPQVIKKTAETVLAAKLSGSTNKKSEV